MPSKKKSGKRGATPVHETPATPATPATPVVADHASDNAALTEASLAQLAASAAAVRAALAPTSPGFPVVGIGASAGGLAAFEAFFAGMPADVDTGMAFVLVQHLAPDHKSVLTEIIRRYTRMQVFEVQDGMAVRPDCAYIIPPGRDMAFLDGRLQLLDPAEPRHQRLPIDFFFRSLADDQRRFAIGIVLSGTGSDGALGVRAIKGAGGMVLAQTPETAAFDGMPRSAIATGMVDHQLAPTDMPAKLMGYVNRAFGRLEPMTGALGALSDSTIKRIFVLLRAHTGHDFSQYKPNTVNRRIERRMSVHQIESAEEYAKYLQQTPHEVEALFRDLLIGVTNFFRDADAFRVLEKEGIPAIFKQSSPGAVIRVWCAGCSTGEEAYSVAILLAEHMESAKISRPVQLFATDIDGRAINIARAGVYPANIAADVSPERLARFFTTDADQGTYRINKSIRDMMVFSEQDLIKDPPFSRLDLLCCRNLLIYLNSDLQKRLMPIFYYALKPGSLLFLGSSEGVGEFENLFAPVDRKAKMFRRLETVAGAPAPTFSQSLSPVSPSLPASGVSVLHPPGKPSLRELAERVLLQQVAPAAALVNEGGDILYLHGRTGMYLEPSPGEAGVSNILKMARDGLRHVLSAALHHAVTTREITRHFGLRVKTNGHHTLVNLTVCPVGAVTAHPGSGDSLFLVVLDEAPTPPAVEPAGPIEGHGDSDARIAALKQELRYKEEYLLAANEELQSSNEELQSSTEELRSANEEMQSVNEELQSTNEEMETSREELQSVNEELSTVNVELQTKVTDLSRSNNDMNNLLGGTGIGTVFVDHQLRILRFTPAASAITNLMPSDVGRPVSHIASNLVGVNRLADDARAVLETLVPREAEVATVDGRRYTMRIQPYRTLDNVIEGAVISFLDITEMTKVREALAKANELMRLAVVVRDAHDAITVQDLTGRMIAWNPGAVALYGWSEAEALQMDVHARIPESQRSGALEKLMQLSRATVLQPYRTERLTKSGATIPVMIVSTALTDESGKLYAVATTERAIEAN